MGELLLDVKGKIGVVTSAVLHLPSQDSVDTLYNELTQTTTQIMHFLNPSPLAHVMAEGAEVVDDFVSHSLRQEKLMGTTINRAMEWNVRHLKRGLELARNFMEKAGDLDKAVLAIKDLYLTRFMEFKAGNYIPEPIERIFC